MNFPLDMKNFHYLNIFKSRNYQRALLKLIKDLAYKKIIYLKHWTKKLNQNMKRPFDILIKVVLFDVMKSYIAYYRVSTDRQGRSGLGLNAQRNAVAGYLSGRGHLLAEFTEIESGQRKDRPQLTAALNACRQHRSTLVIARLDRLARNVHFISGLMESNADFVACDMPEASRLTIHILAAVAEHEREIISQRTKEALREAKARGIRLGNPYAINVVHLAHQANREQAHTFAAPLLLLVYSMRQQGMTLQAIANEMNQRRISTARGGSWHPQTIQNLLARAEAIGLLYK